MCSLVTLIPYCLAGLIFDIVTKENLMCKLSNKFQREMSQYNEEIFFGCASFEIPYRFGIYFIEIGHLDTEYK